MLSFMRSTIGCDLGDKNSRVCCLTADARVETEATVRTTRQGMREFFSARAKARVVLEVGTHSRWVSELLKSLGHEVVVANPRDRKSTRLNSSHDQISDAKLL